MSNEFDVAWEAAVCSAVGRAVIDNQNLFHCSSLPRDRAKRRIDDIGIVPGMDVDENSHCHSLLCRVAAACEAASLASRAATGYTWPQPGFVPVPAARPNVNPTAKWCSPNVLLSSVRCQGCVGRWAGSVDQHSRRIPMRCQCTEGRARWVSANPDCRTETRRDRAIKVRSEKPCKCRKHRH